MNPRRLFLVLAPTLAIATAALAQPAGPAGSPPAAMREGPHGEAMRAHHEAMMRQRLDDLRTVLRLRPDQEAALAAFMAAREPRRFDGKRAHPGARTTPQRLEEMARREETMRAAHQKKRDALATFYAALSPDQQKVFDALQRLEKGHHGRPGHGMGRGHGMMMRHGPGGHDAMTGHDAPGARDR